MGAIPQTSQASLCLSNLESPSPLSFHSPSLKRNLAIHRDLSVEIMRHHRTISNNACAQLRALRVDFFLLLFSGAEVLRADKRKLRRSINTAPVSPAPPVTLWEPSLQQAAEQRRMRTQECTFNDFYRRSWDCGDFLFGNKLVFLDMPHCSQMFTVRSWEQGLSFKVWLRVVDVT